MRRMAPVFTAIVAALACGVVHGLWTDRWGLSAEPAASAARLAQVSLNLPEWEKQDTAGDRKLARDMAGHLYYRFVHRRSGKVVTVFLVCDRPGPISIHTPPDCYGAGGYEVQTQKRWTAKLDDGSQATFWTARFQKERSAESTNLRIFWGWNAAGKWEAADSPRTLYARYPALFKMYFIRELASPDEPLDGEPCVELMRQLLPQVQQALFPAS